MKRIWIKTGRLSKRYIENVESFDIKSSMEIEGNIVPTSPAFWVKHTGGGFSVTPVPNLLNTEWGIDNAVPRSDKRLCDSGGQGDRES